MHFMSKFHKEVKKEEKKIDIDKIFNLKKIEILYYRWVVVFLMSFVIT